MRGDSEHRANQLVGAIEGLADLLTLTATGMSPNTESLAMLMQLIADEAKRVVPKYAAANDQESDE